MIQIELNHVTLQFHPEVGHLTDDVKHLHNGARSQARIFFVTLDREGLSWSGLTICKDTDIIAINSTLDKALAVLKNLILSWFLIKYGVKVVVLGTVSMSNSQWHLVSFGVALDSLFRIRSFSLREGSDTAVDSDFTFHIFQLVQKLLALSLLFFVLLGYLVEFSRALLQLLFHED